MSRPTTHQDLTEYERRGETLFSWQYGLDAVPSVQHHIVQAKLAALKLGFEVTPGEVRALLTEKELDAKLDLAQKKWDLGMTTYDQVCNRERAFAVLSWEEKNAATFYANREDLIAPGNIYEEADA